MKLGIDLDGVVADFVTAANNVLNEKFGHTVNGFGGDIPTWSYLPEQHGEEAWSWLWRKAVPNGLFLSAKPIAGAVEVVTQLAGEHDIYFLTQRPKNARRDTYKWVLYHFPIQPAGIITFHAHESKAAFPCDVYIDDKPENIERLGRESDAMVVIQRREYNRYFPWPVEVENLTDFKRIVDLMPRLDHD